MFLTNQTCKLLLTYLNERLAKGENLTPESPLIAPDELRGNHKMKFLPSHRISKLVREVFRSLGIKSRPYVLRSFHDMQLLQAQNKLGLNRGFRVFWMAHKGDIEHRYTLNKCTLPDELIEQMKEQFKKCEEFLDLEMKEEDPLLEQKQQWKAFIDRATPEQMQKMPDLKLLDLH